MQTNSSPKISVVIPNFNRALELRRCLESLVNQTFKDFEVLVVDDGSSDNSAGVANSFKDRLDLHFYTGPNSGGPAQPRNRGVNLASSEYVAFLDSDDWWLPDKIAHSYSALQNGADIVYHDLFIVRSLEQTVHIEKIKTYQSNLPMFEALLCTGLSIPNSSVVVRKALLELIGGVSEDVELVSVEDLDMLLRLARVTNCFVRLPTCDGYYWAGGGNISSPSPVQLLKIQKLYEKHLGDLSKDDREVALGFLAYRLARIAQQYGDFKTARQYFYKAFSSAIDLRFKLKAIYFYMKAVLGY